jgi:hypothetical protein
VTEKPHHSLLLRILRGFITVLAAFWIFIEEWIWDTLKAAMAWVGRLPGVHWVEVRIAKLPPYAAMSIFAIPWLILIPAKFFALWLLGSGHARSGIAVFVVAKVIGTAVLARLFTLTKPALLRIGWFERLYKRFVAWRERIYAYVRRLAGWRVARYWMTRLRTGLRAWMRALFGG